MLSKNSHTRVTVGLLLYKILEMQTRVCIWGEQVGEGWKREYKVANENFRGYGYIHYIDFGDGPIVHTYMKI